MNGGAMAPFQRHAFADDYATQLLQSLHRDHSRPLQCQMSGNAQMLTMPTHEILHVTRVDIDI